MQCLQLNGTSLFDVNKSEVRYLDFCIYHFVKLSDHILLEKVGRLPTKVEYTTVNMVI